jgi:hypothetical protein
LIFARENNVRAHCLRGRESGGDAGRFDRYDFSYIFAAKSFREFAAYFGY